MTSPAKSRRKVVEKVQLLIGRVCTFRLSISRFSSEKNYSTERRKIGIKSHRQILQSNVAPHQNSEKNRSYARYNPPKKVNLASAARASPKFARRTQDETLHQENQACGVAWDLAQSVYKLKNTDKATVYSPIHARWTKEMTAATAPTSKNPKEREFVVDFGASVRRVNKKRTDAQMKWILYGDPESAQRW